MVPETSETNTLRNSWWEMPDMWSQSTQRLSRGSRLAVLEGRENGDKKWAGALFTLQSIEGQ